MVSSLFNGFFSFQKERVARKEVTGSTLKNYLKPIRLFCEMNSILVNWKLITRGLPKAKSFGDDRPPTMEEILKLMTYPDKRIKPLVSLMLSSGIRIGAFEYLKWKHIIPLENGCAKIIVYAGEPEQYYSFVTPECLLYLQEYMKYRKSYGEVVGPDSPVIRDLWQIKNRTYLEKNRLAKNPGKNAR